MNDILWSITQESRVLQELRKNIYGIWADEAAREINGRYLDPHETDCNQMLMSLNQQQDTLDKFAIKLQSADDFARQAAEFAEIVADRLKLTEQEITSAYGYYDVFAQYNAEARSKFPLVQDLINHANSACG